MAYFIIISKTRMISKDRKELDIIYPCSIFYKDDNCISENKAINHFTSTHYSRNKGIDIHMLLKNIKLKVISSNIVDNVFENWHTEYTDGCDFEEEFLTLVSEELTKLAN